MTHTEYGTMTTNGKEAKMSENPQEPHSPEHLELMNHLLREIHNRNPGGVLGCLKELVASLTKPKAAFVDETPAAEPVTPEPPPIVESTEEP